MLTVRLRKNRAGSGLAPSGESPAIASGRFSRPPVRCKESVEVVLVFGEEGVVGEEEQAVLTGRQAFTGGRL